MWWSEKKGTIVGQFMFGLSVSLLPNVSWFDDLGLLLHRPPFIDFLEKSMCRQAEEKQTPAKRRRRRRRRRREQKRTLILTSTQLCMFVTSWSSWKTYSSRKLFLAAGNEVICSEPKVDVIINLGCVGEYWSTYMQLEINCFGYEATYTSKSRVSYAAVEVSLSDKKQWSQSSRMSSPESVQDITDSHTAAVNYKSSYTTNFRKFRKQKSCKT